jgi:hypothetical protein
MLIDVSKLDPKLTYHVNEIGNGNTSKILKNLQHPKYKKIKKADIATHSLILFNKNGVWTIFENHLKWKGTKQYSLQEYHSLEMGDEKRHIVNPYEFDLDMIEYLTKNNPGYQVLDLAGIAIKRLTGLPAVDLPGLVCSSTVAQCGVKICNELGLKINLVAPVDWQYYFLKA